MLRRRHLAAGAAALALAVVLAWPRAPREVVTLSRGEAAAPARLSAATPAVGDAPGALIAPPAPGARAQAPVGSRSVPVTVTSDRKLGVGDAGELVVGVGGDPAVADISFTIQLDANVLQVRSGAEGDWAAAVDAGARRFSAEIGGAEDRLQVRSIVTASHPALVAGSVARVQFQAVAPGSSWVLVSDVVLKDAAGKTLPFALSPSSLPVSVESPPAR